MTDRPVIEALEASVYKIPTDRPEADGTLHWDNTTVLVVEAVADSGERGLGLSYCSSAAVGLVRDRLEKDVVGESVDSVRGCWLKMIAAVRNMGRPGIAATAISAVDIALWDLKAKVAGQPLFKLLGAARDRVPIYGSGGFTSYTERELVDQLAGWVEKGIPRVKMKIGTDWGNCAQVDVARAKAVRKAVGPEPEIFVDANGAYTVKQACHVARELYQQGVTYFEEPVSSDHLDELNEVRQGAPMAIAAGEYGYDPWYFRKMLGAEAVDVIQADVTRCLGVTGWLQAADIAYGFATTFSAHCCPTVHAHIGCVAPAIAHVEYFWDHSRIDSLIFDGAPSPQGGFLQPDPNRPGLGLELKRQDAEQWRIA